MVWTPEIIQMIWKGIGETLYMTLMSTALGYLFGLPMGVLLAVSDKEGLAPNRWLYKVLDVAAHIKPSARGELEITTVNQQFLEDGELKVQTLGRGFAWLDTGTHDSLSEASTFIEVIEKRQGLKVACLEGIAYRRGWITEERMRELAQPMIKNQYGQYLLKVIEELK